MYDNQTGKSQVKGQRKQLMTACVSENSHSCYLLSLQDDLVKQQHKQRCKKNKKGAFSSSGAMKSNKMSLKR